MRGHFLEHLDSKQESVGRTLNFISQEMGREINTLGAKAYDADIQRLVVQMKDERRGNIRTRNQCGNKNI